MVTKCLWAGRACLAAVCATCMGCAGAPPAPQAPAGTGAGAPDGTAKVVAEPDQASKLAATATTTATLHRESVPALTDSRWRVAGESLSKVAPARVLEGFAKAGWARAREQAVSVLVGAYENVTFDIVKGKANGRVQLIRRAPTPGKPTDIGTVPADCGDDPSTSPASLGTASFARVHDAEADLCLLVQIKEGPADSAKKALGAVVTGEKRR